MKPCDLKNCILRQTVTVERMTTASDGMGGLTRTWGQVQTIRASIQPAGTAERIEAQRMQSEISHVLYTRYQTGIQPTDRISYMGRVFYIVGRPVNVMEAQRWLKLQLLEGVAT